MRDWGSVIACALIVLVLGWGARRVAASAWESVVRYRTPYNLHAKLPGGPRVVERVVLVTIDGLRLDASRRLRFLNELRKRGADGRLQAGQPSLSNPGRAAMATGAWADVHGITSNFALQRVDADSVFSLAHAAGLRNAVAGTPFWYRGFAPYVDDLLRGTEEPHFLPPDELLRWQQDRCAESLEFAKQVKFDFLALDYTAGDEASHGYGPLSADSERIFNAIDGCLRDLVATVDLQRTALLVTSDHGHIASGGHGGSEPEVLDVPLVVTGAAAQAGAQFRARQVDIAPTICFLLGLPFPSTCGGTVLVEALQLGPDFRKAMLARLEQQQKELASHRSLVLLGTPEVAATRARQGRSRVAELGGVALIVLFVSIFAGILNNPAQWRGALVVLPIFYLTYWFLLGIFGMGYSVSTVNREEYLSSFFFKDMVAAGAALLAAGFTMGALTGHFGRFVQVRLGATVTLLVSLSLGARVLWAHWSQGLWMVRWMPDLNVLFRAYLDLLALYGIAFAIWLMPFAVWTGARLRRGPQLAEEKVQSRRLLRWGRGSDAACEPRA